MFWDGMSNPLALDLFIFIPSYLPRGLFNLLFPALADFFLSLSGYVPGKTFLRSLDIIFFATLLLDFVGARPVFLAIMTGEKE